MSTTQTKAQLIADNEALTEQVRALNAEVAMMHAKCETLRAQNLQLCTELTNVCDVASAVNKATARPKYVMPEWQVRRQQEMAAAKAAAMAHHCVVKV